MLSFAGETVLASSIYLFTVFIFIPPPPPKERKRCPGYVCIFEV